MDLKSGREDHGDFTLEYNIEKAGSLTVVEHEQELRFSVPIKVDLKVLWEKEIRTTNTNKNCETNLFLIKLAMF